MWPYLVLWILTIPTQKLRVRECTNSVGSGICQPSWHILYNAEQTVDLGHVGLSYIKLVYCYLSLNLYIHTDIHLDFGRICSELGMTLRMEIL